MTTPLLPNSLPIMSKLLRRLRRHRRASERSYATARPVAISYAAVC
jgi:hypothetical protein